MCLTLLTGKKVGAKLGKTAGKAVKVPLKTVGKVLATSGKKIALVSKKSGKAAVIIFKPPGKLFKAGSKFFKVLVPGSVIPI